MTTSEARKINAQRRIKRLLIEVEASIKKPDSRVYEMVSIKELITKKLSK